MKVLIKRKIKFEVCVKKISLATVIVVKKGGEGDEKWVSERGI